LVCIPTNGNDALENTVNDYFGSAPYFMFYDSTADEFEAIENHNAHHSYGTRHPMNQLAKHHMDCVVCSGMGRRNEALSTGGIKAHQSLRKSVGEIADEINAEKLTKIDPAKACRGMVRELNLYIELRN
jgi:predicted Fe-Mo cluster-binding NifX family protein